MNVIRSEDTDAVYIIPEKDYPKAVKRLCKYYKSSYKDEIERLK